MTENERDEFIKAYERLRKNTRKTSVECIIKAAKKGKFSKSDIYIYNGTYDSYIDTGNLERSISYDSPKGAFTEYLSIEKLTPSIIEIPLDRYVFEKETKVISCPWNFTAKDLSIEYLTLVIEKGLLEAERIMLEKYPFTKGAR